MKQLLFVLYCSLCLVACVNWDVTGPAGPEGPIGPPGQKPPGTDTSSIHGRAFTFDEFTWPIWPIDSVKVTLHLNNDSTLETMADTSGFYQFNGISTGTYNLSFSRNGFGEMKVFGLTHISGGTINTPVPDVSLVQIPIETVVDTAWFDVIQNGYLTLQFRLAMSPYQFPQNGRNVELYFSKNANVSDSNYLFRTENMFYIPKATLDQYFSPGDSMYTRVYTVAKYFAQEETPWNGLIVWFEQMRPGIYYIDPATGRVVFPHMAREGAVIADVYN
jgi:hypothetical protein